MRAFVPYMILSCFAVASVILYIGGCAMDKNWYPAFNSIFGIITVLFAIGFIKSEPSGGWDESKITEDAWFFLLFSGITCCIGFPLVLFHVKTLSKKGLAFQLSGDVCTALGFILFIIFKHNVDENGGY